MSARAYYNEIDPFAAQWLRNLIQARVITQGEVDCRDIRDVRPRDLIGFTRCHFFAGIGVWDSALGLAGWGDAPVWTGSCPCQPFSAAGKGGGFDDERHLWPAWHHLIRECRPATVLGEQVASKDGLGWLDLVHADLEGEGYAVGAADLCAAGVGAPHIRQRLWFVADANSINERGCTRSADRDGKLAPSRSGDDTAGRLCGAGILALAAEPRSQGRLAAGQRPDAQLAPTERGGAAGVMAYANGGECDGLANGEGGECHGQTRGRIEGYREPERRGANRSFWADAEWIACRDGKSRPVEPGTFPLAHGATSRVGRLRSYGNAINREAAIVFIRAVMECIPDHVSTGAQ